MLHIGPSGAPALIFAHGAGAPMDSGFMEAMAALLAERSVQTLRFEFPYMITRRMDGKRRPPDRMPKLEAAFRAAFTEARALVGTAPLFVGGKSMGGRVASHLADDIGVDELGVDELGAAGLVCFGYPFHPPGKPEKLRTEHLATLASPSLIIQGERDRLGDLADVAEYTLSSAISLAWMPDGDHDLKPRKASGFTHDDNMIAAADATARFMKGVS